MLKRLQTSNLYSAMQLGFIGGVIAVLISLVGMVEEFSLRDIVFNVINMGQTFLLMLFVLLGIFTFRRSRSAGTLNKCLEAALAGAVIGLMLWLLVLLIPALNMRSVFLNASPRLIEILTFGNEGVLALLLMMLVGAVGSLLAAVIQALPGRYSGAIFQGIIWVALIGLLQELLQVIFTNLGINGATSWMFGRKGLSILGAVVIFAVVLALTIYRSGKRTSLQARIKTLPAASQRAIRWISFALVIPIVWILPTVLTTYPTDVANSVGLYVLMGLGLNIVVGFAGLLDLGYVAFFAIGAYVMGVLTTSATGPNPGQIVWGPGFTFWEALPISVFAAVMAGVFLGIPVLNIRGDYLAIVTLGFGEIIRIMAGSDFLKPYIGGSQGIVEVGVGQIGPMLFNSPRTLFYLIFVCILLATFIATRLRDSRIGRAWKALREDEDVAQAMGIHLVSTKLMAFATGAAMAGLSGAIFASKIGSIYPHSFKLLVSINVLALIIVGGMGSIPGVFVGGLLVFGLPELLREFSEYRLLVYGALLVVMMLTKPEGFMPEATRKQELHDAMSGEGATPPEAPPKLTKAPAKNGL